MNNMDNISSSLRGTFIPPPDCDPYAKKLLIAYKHPQGVNIQPQDMADQIQGWQQAQENISLLPYKVHVWHYNAGTFNPAIVIVDATLVAYLLCQATPPIGGGKALM